MQPMRRIVSALLLTLAAASAPAKEIAIGAGAASPEIRAALANLSPGDTVLLNDTADWFPLVVTVDNVTFKSATAEPAKLNWPNGEPYSTNPGTVAFTFENVKGIRMENIWIKGGQGFSSGLADCYYGWPADYGKDGGAGVRAVDSSVTITDCVIAGGNGGLGMIEDFGTGDTVCFHGGVSGAALLALRSTVWALGSTELQPGLSRTQCCSNPTYGAAVDATESEIIATPWEDADFDSSGCVDLADFLTLVDYYGQEWNGRMLGLNEFLNLADNWAHGTACNH